MTVCKNCGRAKGMIFVSKLSQQKCRICHKRRWCYWAIFDYGKEKAKDDSI